MTFFNRTAWIALVALSVGVTHSMVVEVQTTPASEGSTTTLKIPSSTPAGDATEPEAIAEPGDAPGEPEDEGQAKAQEQASGELVLEFEITTEQALLLYDNALADFIDARQAYQFIEGHIPFAWNLTAAMMDSADPAVEEVLPFLDPSRPIVVYCGGGDCTDSHALVIRLEQEGFTQLHVFTDGYPAWVAAGGGVQTGEGE